MANLEFPRMLYKPEGEHCVVATKDEYDRAKADKWTDEIPKDWNNVPDPANPGGTLPPKPTSAPPPEKVKAPAAPVVK
jgi:hypothetical protein